MAKTEQDDDDNPGLRELQDAAEGGKPGDNPGLCEGEDVWLRKYLSPADREKVDAEARLFEAAYQEGDDVVGDEPTSPHYEQDGKVVKLDPEPGGGFTYWVKWAGGEETLVCAPEIRLKSTRNPRL